MISLNSLRIDYDEVNAVNNLTLEIKRGQIFGLVGPNGAGKTSTIKAIAGILEPTYGEIKIAGYDLDLEPEKARLQLGYMPDFSPVYENLQVWEYLDVFAAAYGFAMKERNKRVDYWIDRVKLVDKRNTQIRELSRGMRQRLVLAKTLLPDPQVLVLDEPASGLDPNARRDMQDILKEVAFRDKTVLISSHILSELSEFCTAIGIMEKGKMIVAGTLAEVRDFIGSKGTLVIRFESKFDYPTEKIISVLSNIPSVSSIQIINPGEVAMNFSGDNSDAHVLLKKLIALDIPVCEFFVRQANVEDIFFKVGAKETS